MIHASLGNLIPGLMESRQIRFQFSAGYDMHIAASYPIFLFCLIFENLFSIFISFFALSLNSVFACLFLSLSLSLFFLSLPIRSSHVFFFFANFITFFKNNYSLKSIIALSKFPAEFYTEICLFSLTTQF